jgi:hypothetical protein
MVTILSRQICSTWVAHKRTANAYKRFKDGALFKKNNGTRQAVPAVSAKFVQGQVAQALVVQQNGWTATNGQRGPGESHLQIPLECVPE